MVDKYHKGTFQKLPNYPALAFGAKTVIGWSKRWHNDVYRLGYCEHFPRTIGKKAMV